MRAMCVKSSSSSSPSFVFWINVTLQLKTPSPAALLPKVISLVHLITMETANTCCSVLSRKKWWVRCHAFYLSSPIDCWCRHVDSDVSVTACVLKSEKSWITMYLSAWHKVQDRFLPQQPGLNSKSWVGKVISRDTEITVTFSSMKSTSEWWAKMKMKSTEEKAKHRNERLAFRCNKVWVCVCVLPGTSVVAVSTVMSYKLKKCSCYSFSSLPLLLSVYCTSGAFGYFLSLRWLRMGRGMEGEQSEE